MQGISLTHEDRMSPYSIVKGEAGAVSVVTIEQGAQEVQQATFTLDGSGS